MAKEKSQEVEAADHCDEVHVEEWNQLGVKVI